MTTNMTDELKPQSIVKAINAVQKTFAVHGIAKDQRNQQQKFMYRSIDAMYGVLNTALRDAELAIIPRASTHTKDTFTTKNGAVMMHVVIRTKWIIRHSSGDEIIAATYGEAMDSGDKATPKAQTAAFKTLLVELFSIPFAGEPDADAESPELEVFVTISDEQIADLEALLEEHGADKARFLKWAKVGELSEINANAFRGVCEMVARK